MSSPPSGAPRPLVTLSYAQSLDGSLAASRGRPLALSGDEAMKLTHELRAAHDAILVGIGALLADDPRLTVRLVPGDNPQPVVVDSQLRCPVETNLFRHPDRTPWIATTAARADPRRQAELEERGARVWRLPSDAAGRVDLAALLDLLGQQGVKRVMVEGGARVITAFLAARLADRLVITVAPRLVGGLRAVEALGDPPPHLANVSYRVLGPDWIVEADLRWP